MAISSAMPVKSILGIHTLSSSIEVNVLEIFHFGHLPPHNFKTTDHRFSSGLPAGQPELKSPNMVEKRSLEEILSKEEADETFIEQEEIESECDCIAAKKALLEFRLRLKEVINADHLFVKKPCSKFRHSRWAICLSYLACLGCIFSIEKGPYVLNHGFGERKFGINFFDSFVFLHQNRLDWGVRISAATGGDVEPRSMVESIEVPP